MKITALIALFAATTACASAFADEQLVKEKQCLQCHAVDQDKIGPSFKKIAGYWKDKANADQTLIATIRKGSIDGGGVHWSMKAEMPDDSERPLVSEDEAKRIVRWIMRQ